MTDLHAIAADWALKVRAGQKLGEEDFLLGLEPMQTRIAELERERDNWKELIQDEIGENLKLFEELGVASKIATQEHICTAAMCLAAARAVRERAETAEGQLVLARARIEKLEKALRKIVAVPLGPDKPSAQCQLDVAVAYASQALAAQPVADAYVSHGEKYWSLRDHVRAPLGLHLCAECEAECRTGTGRHGMPGEKCYCPCHVALAESESASQPHHPTCDGQHGGHCTCTARHTEFINTSINGSLPELIQHAFVRTPGKSAFDCGKCGNPYWLHIQGQQSEREG